MIASVQVNICIRQPIILLIYVAVTYITIQGSIKHLFRKRQSFLVKRKAGQSKTKNKVAPLLLFEQWSANFYCNSVMGGMSPLN